MASVQSVGSPSSSYHPDHDHMIWWLTFLKAFFASHESAKLALSIEEVMVIILDRIGRLSREPVTIWGMRSRSSTARSSYFHSFSFCNTFVFTFNSFAHQRWRTLGWRWRTLRVLWRCKGPWWTSSHLPGYLYPHKFLVWVDKKNRPFSQQTFGLTFSALSYFECLQGIARRERGKGEEDDGNTTRHAWGEESLPRCSQSVTFKWTEPISWPFPK